MAKTAVPTEPGDIARRIDPTPVHDEMRNSFMPYALSVTTARAIPDVRDGLKPVQRRILYALDTLGLRPGAPHRKSATVVGEVMGKYHPHGDSAIYEAMVRMGQPFAMSLTLVDPRGNFGSLDDPPAAYRYTEARLTEAAMTLVADIDDDTVEFAPNFDGERTEPTCLPALLPNLLVNGASGIAVGMATNMPPHNLGEVAAAVALVLKQRRPKPTVDELMKRLPAPDFPGGGRIIAGDGIRAAYAGGKGSLRVRARAEIENVTARRDRIVVTELPYMVGPERVQARIRRLLQEGKLDDVGAVTDLSDRHSGLRLVIDCRPGAWAPGVLADLYRLTPLEETYSINNVALVNGVPTELSLYDICRHYIDHRLDVIVRRTQSRLDAARAREHIVAGLLVALDRIDLVISIIRGSADVGEARVRLVAELDITEVQADHILDLQLRRLTALEVDKLEAELAALRAAIADCEKLLSSQTRRHTLLGKELAALAKEFAVPRRSQILSDDDVEAFDRLVAAGRGGSGARRGRGVRAGGAVGRSGAAGRNGGNGAADEAGAFTEQVVVVTLSTTGLLGRRASDTAGTAKPGRHDVVRHSLETSLLDDVYAVTDRGRVLSVAAQSIPEMARGSRGASVVEMLSLKRGESVVGLLDAAVGAAHGAGSEAAPVALVTRSGRAKRVARAALSGRRGSGMLMNLAEGDAVVAAFDAPDGTDVVIVASDGRALRTPANGINEQGPAAGGVVAMKLVGGATVVAAAPAEFGTLAVLVTDAGAVKTTDVSELKTFGRATRGVPALKLDGEPARPPATVLSAWIGRGQSPAAVVAAGAGRSVDPRPRRLTLRPTPRSEPAETVHEPAAGADPGPAALRVLEVGEYRF